ncbi:MAG: PAS domain-containing hybrid sensor histidine kinase/response regulator [Comamonadaceae bacterium]|nr:MAG: PAS domain-containing hybrid sensor histidine kinase/response regulator [Comamonadaceae bacterium]
MPQNLAALETVVNMLESLDIGCCIFDRNSRTVRWNSAMLALFPEHAGRIHVGEHYRENLLRFYAYRLSDAELPLIEEYVRAGVERHETQQRPFTFQHRGVWLRVACKPLPDQGRMRIWTRVPSPVAVTDGLLEQQSALGLLEPSLASRHSEPMAVGENVLEYFADGMMLVDVEGRITAVNAQFMALYGFASKATPVGLTLEDVYRHAWKGHEHREPRHYELGIARFAENVLFAGAPFLLPLAGDRWVRVIEQRDSQGHGYFSHVDITALKRQQLESEEAMRFKSRFLASASHDLRQPVHALGMMVEMLDPDLPRDDLAARLGSIRSCTSTLTDMLNELLDLSSFDLGIHRVVKTTVSIAWLVREATDMFGEDAARKGLELAFLPCDIHVLSDKHLLRRIVFNLVSNAVKYTVKGKVSVICVQDGEAVTFTVRDTGIGIAPERLQSIFNDNITLKPTQELNEGLGIGLTVVRLAADLLGHTIQIESVEGVGTSFMLGMPAGRPGDLLKPADSRSEPAGGLPARQPCIVLIEDDSYALSSMAELLTSWGYRVLPCLSAEAALNAISSGTQSPDLVVSDMHLNEDFDGLTAISALRALAPGHALPAILLTGDVSTRLSEAALAADVNIVFKPIRPSALRELITSKLS